MDESRVAFVALDCRCRKPIPGQHAYVASRRLAAGKLPIHGRTACRHISRIHCPWAQRFGGRISLLIRDPRTGHGSGRCRSILGGGLLWCVFLDGSPLTAKRGHNVSWSRTAASNDDFGFRTHIHHLPLTDAMSGIHHGWGLCAIQKHWN